MFCRRTRWGELTRYHYALNHQDTRIALHTRTHSCCHQMPRQGSDARKWRSTRLHRTAKRDLGCTLVCKTSVHAKYAANQNQPNRADTRHTKYGPTPQQSGQGHSLRNHCFHARHCACQRDMLCSCWPARRELKRGPPRMNCIVCVGDIAPEGTSHDTREHPKGPCCAWNSACTGHCPCH